MKKVYLLVLVVCFQIGCRASDDGASKLALAISRNEVDGVRDLLATGVDCHGVDPVFKKPFLFLACDNSEVEVCRILRAFEGEEKLMTERQKQVEIVKLLLDNGADIKIKSLPSNSTALHAACRGSNLDVVRLLLEKGADTEERDASGQTPLYIACASGNLQTISLLLAAGANIQDNFFFTPDVKAFLLEELSRRSR